MERGPGSDRPPATTCRPRTLLAACLLTLVALLAAGCSGSGGDRDPAGTGLQVVATTTQVADLAANVGGDSVQVTSLLKPGIDAHDYEPSPADIDALARADLVLQNGVGLEEWLGDTIESSGYDGPVVDASQGVALRQVEGEPDPHIWQSPGNAQVMAANIERGLATAEPAGAASFEANLAAYTKAAAGARRRGRAADRQPGQQEGGHQPRRLRLLPGPLRPGAGRLGHPQLRHLGRAVGPRHPRPGRQDQGHRGHGDLLRDLAAGPGRPRRSAARPGSGSWSGRTPCTATPSARPGPTATPTSR